MRRRTRRRLPVIYLDEHMPPSIAGVFRPIFRTFEIARLPKFKGRNERSYIHELFAKNGIFITSDREFVVEVVEKGIRHASIVWIPGSILPEEKFYFAQIVSGYIQGACHQRPTVFHNRVLFPADDGLRTAGPKAKESDLEFSWHWLNQIAP